MHPKFNLYLAWMDPMFYAWAAVFAAALFAMVYSIRRYLELKNASGFEEGESEPENPFVEASAGGPAAHTAEQPGLAEVRPEPEAEFQEQPKPAPEPEATATASAPGTEAYSEPTRAENFVRGIYAGIADLDERMKGIEASLSKTYVNNDFAVKFLEDILQDIDSLDKMKIKARIEYLLSDLKK